MKRVALGILLGIVVAATAHGQEPSVERLTELPLETYGRTEVKLPEAYGRLVSVVTNSDVHYLYFEDAAGSVRVVLIGPRGAVPRSRNPLQLLSSDVFLIKRGSEGSL